MNGFAFALAFAVNSTAYAQQQAGASQPTTAEMQWNRELLGSGRIEQIATSMAQANKAAQASVDDSVISRMKSALPTLEQFGSTLKYGAAVVVSSQGGEVISLIRAVAIRKGRDRNDFWRSS